MAMAWPSQVAAGLALGVATLLRPITLVWPLIQAACLKAPYRLRFVYVETPGGGRVDILTSDAEAIAAVHEFMRFQIRDHGTGDTTAVTKR